MALTARFDKVLRVHPVTGKKALFVNPVYTRRFADMTAEESQPLLQYLFDHAIEAEFTCRLAGPLALWPSGTTGACYISPSTTTTEAGACCTAPPRSARPPVGVHDRPSATATDLEGW